MSKKIRPDSLSADVKVADDSAAKRRWWIGALPSLPRNSCEIAGFSFPVQTEVVRINPRSGQTERVPGMGVLRDLTDAQVERIAKAMPRTVVRWAAPRREPLNTIPGDKHNDEGDPTLDAPHGFLLTISTPAEVEMNHSPYTPQHGDEPVSVHLYMKCQRHRDENHPAPLAATGIVIPTAEE